MSPDLPTKELPSVITSPFNKERTIGTLLVGYGKLNLLQIDQAESFQFPFTTLDLYSTAGHVQKTNFK